MKKRKFSLTKKIVLGGMGIFILVGSIILIPKIKHRLTSQPQYKAVQQNEYISPAHEETTSDLVEPGPKAILPSTKWVPQSFNNCGPATTSMILQYFGHTVPQTVTKAALRTNEDDKNVFTYEIQKYIKDDYGIESKLFFNGDREMIKRLIANGFYVMAEDWLHPNEDIGHVTILRGYDDGEGVFIADDSYLGNNIVYKYEEFDQTQWKPFNREYLPLYLPDQEKKLRDLIGKDWDQKIMYEGAVKKAQEEIVQNDRDMYAYFNLGTSYYALKEYQKAWDAFETSRTLGWPKRMLWYQIQPIQTLVELGRYQEALRLADEGLWANDSFAELHVEKARAYSGLYENQKAREEIQKALQYAPNLQSAKDFSAFLKSI